MKPKHLWQWLKGNVLSRRRLRERLRREMADLELRWRDKWKHYQASQKEEESYLQTAMRRACTIELGRDWTLNGVIACRFQIPQCHLLSLIREGDTDMYFEYIAMQFGRMLERELRSANLASLKSWTEAEARRRASWMPANYRGAPISPANNWGDY